MYSNNDINDIDRAEYMICHSQSVITKPQLCVSVYLKLSKAIEAALVHVSVSSSSSSSLVHVSVSSSSSSSLVHVSVSSSSSSSLVHVSVSSSFLWRWHFYESCNIHQFQTLQPFCNVHLYHCLCSRCIWIPACLYF